MADTKISALTSYTPAVDTDVLPIVDTTNTTTKKITWANVKATLKTYFDTLYASALGADDNYVTDAEKVKLSNLSGANTGDQTNITGNAATVTTNANLTGVVTSTGNATAIADAALSIAKTSGLQTALDAKAPLASPTFTGTVVLPATTAGGNITLSENSSIALDPAGSADGKYSGITIAGTAGAALTFGQLCYLAVADSRWELADADAAATMGTPLLGMCVLAAAGDASATTMLLYGTIRADAQFPALTIGATVYGGETAGAIQTAIPTGADNVIRVVGHALTADEILFNPSQDHQITVA